MKRTVVLVVLALGLFAGRGEAAPCETEPTDMSLAYGDQVICDHELASDTDVFRFSGTAGNRILAEALYVSGTSHIPRIQLIAPNGVVLVNTYSPARADILLPQTGTYTVNVFAYNPNTTGQYSFMVSCTSGTCVPSPPPPPIPAPGGDIPCEAEPSDMFPHYGTRVTCELTQSDTDLFRFSATAGDRILAEAVRLTGASFVPRIEVIAPDGTILLNTYSPARADLLLTQTGVYTAVVYAYNASTAGNYAFTVSCTGGLCLPPPFGGPSLTLSLTGCTGCQAGEQFTASAHWQNTSAQSRQVEIKIGLRFPDGTPFNLLGNPHLELTLPAGFDVTGNIVDFAWPASLPAGTWTIEAAVIEPQLGQTFSREVKTFTVTP